MQSAEGVLSTMKQVGIEPSVETYTILICGHIKQGDLQKVDSILKHCEETDICFTNKDYYEMVYCLALFNHDVDKVW